MTARASIVEALGAIDSLKPYTSEPDQKHAGAAWPVLREVTRDGTLCAPFTRAYDVFAVLPNGYGPAAVNAAEDLIEVLIEALEPLGEWVQPAETVQIAFDNKSVLPGIRVRVIPDPEEG